MEKSSLIAQARQQLEAARRATSGRSAKTVHGGHEKVLRQTVIAMCAGRSTDEFNNPGEATVHVLTGRVRLTCGPTTWDGSPGDLLIAPQTPHALHAVEDSVILLTVAKTSRPD
ncbi:cupin domain-containing protein [Actinotalea sp. K2]|uniref:cupin domain-containing protein n=1 Tax=Actinotalea sp. K2 TaxID=2939438 RepID=UPI0020182013|nr:cupin domain-containing protein [Actinotalea sp. K2]MCL3862407.1 cupin domain-containing protein [Actinotalea sp. K2]